MNNGVQYTGTFSASDFDRFLSESCAKPEWVIITGETEEDIQKTINYLFSTFDTTSVKRVKNVDGLWEEVVDADSGG